MNVFSILFSIFFLASALIHFVEFGNVVGTQIVPLSNNILVVRVNGLNGVLAVVGEGSPTIVHHTTIVVGSPKVINGVTLILDKVGVVN